ncbi:MAG: hypothetical protein IPK13_17190 [Deltaproteobacteria bacterium]|nr:hypothetical protein [Deltaproteobacteria bacterium]
MKRGSMSVAAQGCLFLGLAGVAACGQAPQDVEDTFSSSVSVAVGGVCGALSGDTCEPGAFCAGLTDDADESGTCIVLGGCFSSDDCAHPENQAWRAGLSSEGSVACVEQQCVLEAAADSTTLAEGDACGFGIYAFCGEGLYCGGLSDFEEEPGTCVVQGSCKYDWDCFSPENQAWRAGLSSEGSVACVEQQCVLEAAADSTTLAEGDACGFGIYAFCGEGLYCGGLSDFEEEPGKCVVQGSCKYDWDCFSPENQAWRAGLSSEGSVACVEQQCVLEAAADSTAPPHGE